MQSDWSLTGCIIVLSGTDSRGRDWDILLGCCYHSRRNPGKRAGTLNHLYPRMALVVEVLLPLALHRVVESQPRYGCVSLL